MTAFGISKVLTPLQQRFPYASRARSLDTHTRIPGEPRDWFFKDQLAAADKPLPFSLMTGLERKKQIEVKVLRFAPPPISCSLSALTPQLTSTRTLPGGQLPLEQGHLIGRAKLFGQDVRHRQRG